MGFDITGKLIEKFNEQKVSEKFKKREFVIEKTENNFTEQIKFQLVQDKTGVVEPFKVGEQIKVFFDIKGSKWKEAYFVNLQAWKIERLSNEKVAQDAPPAYTQDDIPPPSIDDDLPF